MTVLIIMAIFGGAAYVIVSPLRRHVHMMQQHTYRIDRYWQWYAARWRKEYRKAELVLFLPPLLALINTLAFAIAEICLCGLLLLIYWPRPAREKKPLVFTPRARRLYVLAVALVAADALILLIFPYPLLIGAALIVMCALASLYVIAANWLLGPRERSINDGFLHQAADKIAGLPELVKIGITGSYGKTSTKLIMGAVLGEKYRVCVTPGSFNTPMGVTRVIRETLSPLDEIFVCEMGAKQRGDIAELCALVRPKLGVLTAIGEQHLESFGSVEAIIDTKFELIESLPPDGLAIVNGDDPRIAANLQRSPSRVLRYGLNPEFDYWADQISYGPQGATFVYHHGGESGEFSTCLLGRHMVSNILASLAVADQLGLSLAQMQRAVKALRPIEHRLQLRPAGDYSVIDDAFNANPAGAKAALEVLAAFGGGQKIIVTPGMVELGEREYELNFELGRHMAAVCDWIILVGPAQSRPLREGALAADYARERLIVVADLNEARQHLGRIVRPGDVVLFENDLPDTYNE
ncbi:MAG: UDP-N-acetylmuramoyl-tripeptide--D-alanyl-D-alanine ligase [Clostridia bacterium]|nr:UDP-N-acetylmuramoyl-tripeptide--D-alanyl-D-alanine ligase [Clostridia bacterium]